MLKACIQHFMLVTNHYNINMPWYMYMSKKEHSLVTGHYNIINMSLYCAEIIFEIIAVDNMYVYIVYTVVSHDLLK